MKMNKYWNYLKYILEHKKNVFIECWKRGLYFHAFTHDLSKFSPVEFISYTKHFYGTKEDKIYSNFDYGWLNHQRKNKHHWDYWVDSDGVALRIPEKYIKQMVCDWKAMGRKFGDTAQSYYLNNKQRMKLNSITVILLERELGIQ